jgi:hypothetical protein
MKRFAPMLASSYNGENLDFPVLATPKVDGVRTLKVNGDLVSRVILIMVYPNVQYLLEYDI